MTSLPPFEARLLAARLGAEGILWQLRGESAVYPISAVEVLVEADEIDRARALLEPAWVPDTADGLADRFVARHQGEDATAGGRPGRRARAALLWLVTALVLLAMALQISHLG